MKIRIVVYKGSGKYYTEGIAESEKEIPLWEDEFKVFVANNLPTKYSGGYITVEDTDDHAEGFHCALYRFDEIVKYRSEG